MDANSNDTLSRAGEPAMAFLVIDEVAERLGLSPEGARGWLHDHRVPVIATADGERIAMSAFVEAVSRAIRPKRNVPKFAAIAALVAASVLGLQAAFANSPPLAGETLPRQVTYRGALEQNGQPAQGSFAMKFSLFTASTDGTLLYAETKSAVSVIGGRFSVDLGDCDPTSSCVDGSGAPTNLSAALVRHPSELYLGAAVSGGGLALTELTGRQRLTSAPSALEAKGRVLGYWRNTLDGTACEPATTSASWNTQSLKIEVRVPAKSRLEVKYFVPLLRSSPSSTAIPFAVGVSDSSQGDVLPESIGWAGVTINNFVGKQFSLPGRTGSFLLTTKILGADARLCPSGQMPSTSLLWAGPPFIEVTAYAE